MIARSPVVVQAERMGSAARALRDRVRLRLAAPPPPIVLVVEDARETADLVVAMLTAAGFEAESVPTLAGARFRLSRGDVGAVIVDQGLPDGDGWVLASEMPHAIAVALMSASVEEPDLAALRRRTGAEAIVCPSDPGALVNTIRALLAQRR